MPSIEKMMFADIAGLDTDLDAVLDIISSCGCFHIEDASKQRLSADKTLVKRENPYTALVKMLSEISSISGLKLEQVSSEDLPEDNITQAYSDIQSLRNKVQKLKAEVKKAEDMLNNHKIALGNVKHLDGLTEDSDKLLVEFDKIFSCKHIKVRFGKLPLASYEKLPYYDDKNFFFMAYEKNTTYCWGFCFIPVVNQEEVDKILETLYFERIWIPDFLKGNADDAVAELERDLIEDAKIIEEKQEELAKYVDSQKDLINKYFTRYKALHDTFELREKVLMIRDKFYIVGFVPEADAERFKEFFKDLKTVSVMMKPSNESSYEVPVKMKNNKFSEPFSMFVELYGLPAYNDINPTNIVAISYTLLFGIMFGDLGQGFLVAIIGLILWKTKKMTLGRIMERLGVSSMIFGTLYGSVFGYEELLDPVYESLGISFLPFHAMHNVNTVLYGAICIGIVIILISIIINIIMGLKEKNYVRALFSNNGLAGLIFFASLLGLVVGMILGISLGTAPYIICLIILQLVVMFFREPLGDMMKGEGFHIHESVGDFIAANFFECFEFLLGYATNTLSFVRVGGFVLSHAGMMSVVLSLADMTGNASIVVMIIGNIFVMVLEGMLVGIQVLRLEFYEMFSRFYTGGGKEFKTVSINYNETIE